MRKAASYPDQHIIVSAPTESEPDIYVWARERHFREANLGEMNDTTFEADSIAMPGSLRSSPPAVGGTIRVWALIMILLAVCLWHDDIHAVSLLLFLTRNLLETDKMLKSDIVDATMNVARAVDEMIRETVAILVGARLGDGDAQMPGSDSGPIQDIEGPLHTSDFILL